MVEQKTEFRKLRDFGENLNDTFVFLGQNLGPLLKSVFAISGVFMIIQAILGGLYQYQSFGLLQEVMAGSSTGDFKLMFRNIFTWQYVAVLCFPFIVLTTMQVACGAYVKFYLENNRQQPNIDEVWSIFGRFFFKVLGFNFLAGLMILVGFLFCFFPGIYLWVVLVPLPFVAIIEEKSFPDAVSRCFVLIKQNFWPTFLLYIVASLIYSFSGAIVGGVISLIIGLVSYLSTDDLRKTIGIASSFMNIFSYGFYVIFMVSALFQYFNMVEQKDGTGILNRINEMGNNNPAGKMEDQY